MNKINGVLGQMILSNYLKMATALAYMESNTSTSEAFQMQVTIQNLHIDTYMAIMDIGSIF